MQGPAEHLIGQKMTLICNDLFALSKMQKKKCIPGSYYSVSP